MFLDLNLKLFRALYKLSLLTLVLLLNGCELGLQLLLMHGEALDLATEDLHPGRGHHTSHVRNHRLAEYLVDQPMVPHVPGVGHVLYTQTIIGIFFILCRLK